MTSLESSWDLRSNSAPRSLCVYEVPSAPVPSPSDRPGIGGGGGGGGGRTAGVASTNPFDGGNPFDAASSSSTATSFSRGGPSTGGSGGATTAASGGGRCHAVVFGTERGALHYRAYARSKAGRGGTQQQPLGVVATGGATSTSSGGGGAGGGGGGGTGGGTAVHPLHKPVDLNGAVPGAVVSIVRAFPPPPSPSVDRGVGGGGGIGDVGSGGGTVVAADPPILLLLVDDNRGTASISSSSPGAYASHLVTLRRGSFATLPPYVPPPPAHHYHPHGLDTSGAVVVGGGGVGKEGLGLGVAGGPGGGGVGGGSSGGIGVGSFSSSSSSLPGGGGAAAAGGGGSVPLPRMSCASYHPSAGYVYAAGGSVMSLPAAAIAAVAAALADRGGGSDGGIAPVAGAGGVGPPEAGGPTPPSPARRHRSLGLSVGGAEYHRGGLHHHHHHPPSLPRRPAVLFDARNVLPNPGARSGQDALALCCAGRVAVVAVGNAFYAVPGRPAPHDTFWASSSRGGGFGSRADAAAGGNATAAAASSASSSSGGGGGAVTKIMSFTQSSQVHPVIAVDVGGGGGGAAGGVTGWSSATASVLFLASGRECAALEVLHDPSVVPSLASAPPSARRPADADSGGGSAEAAARGVGGDDARPVSATPPRHGIATLASPILAAALVTSSSSSSSSHSTPRLVAVLTSDGLISTRSPSCIAIPLSTVEVGNRPNDFFVLRSVPPLVDGGGRGGGRGAKGRGGGRRAALAAASYSGEGRLIVCRPDRAQDLADRLMKLSIDAFGANGFPRSELAEAVAASFSATSYVGPEPTPHTRALLRQYLEAVLGLSDDFGSGMSAWPTDDDYQGEDDDEDEGQVRRDGAGGAPWEGRYGAFDLEDDRRKGGVAGRASAAAASVPPPDPSSSSLSSPSPPAAALLSGTALLCLACSQISPPNASLANRAAKSAASRIGIAPPEGIDPSAAKVCDLVATRLLREASTGFSLVGGASTTATTASVAPGRGTSRNGTAMEFAEAAVWLLRSCGHHERAIDVLHERMRDPSLRNRSPASPAGEGGGASSSSSSKTATGGWSQLKYDSFAASHLGELWSSRREDGRCGDLVLRSPATRRLLEDNPRLGLSVFASAHPRNEREWADCVAADDPLADRPYPPKVVELLKSINPVGSATASSTEQRRQRRPERADGGREEDGSDPLPLESGRALAVTYLESAVGISTGRPVDASSPGDDDAFASLPVDKDFEERAAGLHDELSYLLLEGVIAERGDDDDHRRGGAAADVDTELGGLYRAKLRRFLGWPNAKVRSERLLASLPSSFLREHALLLGRLGRHEDALRILYCDLRSLDLALEYCDARHKRQRLRQWSPRNQGRGATDFDAARDDRTASPGAAGAGEGCAYLPLVRVALESDEGADRGTTAAIQVLALRRGSIDRGAALRLLPRHVPVSAVARPFLIPALVDGESQARRLTVAASLLRARYVRLRRDLTEAQIKSQSSLRTVPALRPLNLGEPLHSTKPLRAKPAHSASSTFPDVTIVKHFFPRHVVIQAKVTNSAPALDGRALGDVSFVVAESSDEAVLPSTRVSLKALPGNATGCAWTVLSAAPQRLDGTATLTCELRYTVLSVDAATGAPLSFGGGGGGTLSSGLGRAYVEELQDMEIHAAHFSM